MKKMESKKLRGPRWWDSFVGPKNSNSKWVQENLEEMNWNFRRMLKIIEDSNAESFAKKVEMYYQSRQELIDLVYKCYRIHRSLATRHNHATGEPLINIPNLDLIPAQGRDIIISNVSSGKSSAIQSRPRLSKFPSSKQINAPVCSVSKQLKRRVSVKGPTMEIEYVKFSDVYEYAKEPKRDSYDYDDDDEELQHEGTDELEAELCDMIEKLYIQMEGGRDVSKLQGKISRHEDNACDCDGEFRKVNEFVSSNGEFFDDNDDDEELQHEGTDEYYDDDDDDDDDEEEEELQHEGTDELEADLCDMIEKLYIEMEGDRVVSMLQGGILRYEDNAHDNDEEFRQVRESISSNVDKALLEENLELQAEICRRLKVMSYLEEYIEERIEAETLFASEVEQLKASIVKKNNDVEELDKILEAVEAERDQLKARLAMLEA